MAETQTPPSDSSPPFRPMPEGAEFLTHEGNCYCEKYSFTIQHPALDVRQPIACNCHWCQVTGIHNIYADENLFTLTTNAKPGDDAPMGVWNATGGFPITHYFCEKCSANIYWRGIGKIGVNVRLLNGVDIEKLKMTPLDMKSENGMRPPG